MSSDALFPGTDQEPKGKKNDTSNMKMDRLMFNI